MMPDKQELGGPEKGEALSNEERRNIYNRTVRQAELKAIMLSNLSFKVNRSVLSDARPKAFYGTGDIVGFSFDKDRRACAARVLWKVELKVERKQFVKCAAQYDAIYNGFECGPDIARLFIENVARSATYSYFRALYASLDWGADIGSPPLPVIKFQPKV
jgi:hypothetical protein